MRALDAGADDYACFLGAGSYDHAVPSRVTFDASICVSGLKRVSPGVRP